MREIRLFDVVGSFAENKDQARKIRLEIIIPALDAKEEVALDFAKIDSATQSFIHALISDVLRRFGSEILDKVYFKNCNETIRKIIDIVVEYMQDTD